MAICVQYDLHVAAHFWFRDTWPIALVAAIKEQKGEIYKSLAPNPLEPDMLVAERTFQVEGHDYVVIFGIDRKRAFKNIFRVMYVERAVPT